MSSFRETTARRSLLLLLAIGSLYVFLALNFGYLMVYPSGQTGSVEVRSPLNRRPEPPRGKIVDTRGNILATSIQRPSLYANPRAVENPRAIARELGPLIELSPKQIYRRLRLDRYFIWLARKLPPPKARKIKRLGLTGLGFMKEYERVYPKQELAAQVLGYVGIDNHGLEGIEKQFDTVLSEPPQSNLARAQPIGSRRTFERGSTLHLTLDQTIQHIVEEELRRMARREDPKNAMAVVMEPSTGRIRALANWPTFNPNQFAEYDRTRQRNRVITHTFEPGSTLKAMTLSIGLATNSYRPGSTFRCPGFIYLPEAQHTLNCYANHGEINLPEILIKSCNVGTVKAVQQIKRPAFYQRLREFGFGTWTGIQLPGESKGRLRRPAQWSTLTQPSMAIGQGISTTTLQLTTALAGIVNDGILMRPRIAESITRGQRTVKRVKPFTVRRVLPKHVARNMRTYMKKVVKQGTGKQARSSKFVLAGKTGTAQKANLKEGGYYKNRVLTSFIGFGPGEDPRLVASVVVDEPRKGRYGGEVAAPVFRRIMERSLRYLNHRST